MLGIQQQGLYFCWTSCLVGVPNKNCSAQTKDHHLAKIGSDHHLEDYFIAIDNIDWSSHLQSSQHPGFQKEKVRL